MKRFYLLLLGAVCVIAIQAQIIEQGEPALVYYTPQTTIAVTLQYSIETQEPGIYAQYAKELLGVDNAITEKSTSYRLKEAHIGTNSSADYMRPHKVSMQNGSPILLSINEKGILKGYNLPFVEKKKEEQKTPHHETFKHPKKSSCLVPPYPDDAIAANTLAAKAKATAAQIMHLRETRMYILNGEVEHAPADGEAMRLVLKELEERENALTELFIGHKRHHTKTYKASITPSMDDENMLKEVYYFSEENGFTTAENIDADSIVIAVALHPQTLTTPPADTDKKNKKKTTSELSPIVYNLPGYGDVTITYKGDKLCSRTIPIAQIGVDVPLPQSLFNGNEQPTIRFCEKTGNIISIEK